MTVGGLRAGRSRESGDADTVRAAGHEVRFRLPDTRDLLAAAGAHDAAAAKRVLVRRCVIEASRDGAGVPADALPADVIAAVERAMAERDPQADVSVALTCPECGHEWAAPLDVGAYVWTEVDQWARRTLADVAALAAAFGWTEADVLRLGPARREAYLELATR
jgi:hypothetical protein